MSDIPLNTAEGVIEISDIYNGQFSQSVAIIATRTHEVVVSRLIDGAIRACHEAGLASSHISLIRVNGALELPLALKKAALSSQFNAFVVLGAVIKGQTDHYDHVARMANDGVLAVALEHHLALGNGILTVHSLEHALERAEGFVGNLGFDAMCAALSLSTTFFHLDKNISGQ